MAYIRSKEFQEIVEYNDQLPLLKFPEELTSYLFSFIKPSEIIQGVKLTCKLWSRIASDNILWENLARKAFEKPLEKKEAAVLCYFNGEKRYAELLCEAAAHGSERAQEELLINLKDLEHTVDSCRLFKELADKENPWAQYCLATLYFHFGGKYQKAAFELLKKASDKGVLHAQFYWGKSFYEEYSNNGLFHYKNSEQKTTEERSAIEEKGKLGESLVLDLCDKGFAEAQIYAVRNFALPKEVKKDLLRKACEAGNPSAIYFSQFKKKSKNRRQTLERAAHLGSAKAAFELGHLKAQIGEEIPEDAILPYRLGHQYGKLKKRLGHPDDKLKKDPNRKAEAWKQLRHYEESLMYGEKLYGSLPLQCTQILLSGLVLQKDESQALHWFKKIVAFREDLNEKFFDNILILTKLIEENPAFCTKITEFYTKKAEMGKAYYQFRLADLYEHGKYGMEKNVEKALELFEEAAEAGDLDAINRLCYVYGIGEYGKKDSAKFKKLAIQLYELSEKKGKSLLFFMKRSLNVKESLIEYLQLNYLNENNKTLTKKKTKTLNNLVTKAKQGNYKACFNLGRKLREFKYRSDMKNLFSDEVVQEINAFRNQKKDYELQLVFNLGRLFFGTIYCSPIRKEELRLFRAALKDEYLFVFRLCLMHLTGSIISRDEEKALEYFEKLLNLDAKQKTHRAKELLSQCSPEIIEKILRLLAEKNRFTRHFRFSTRYPILHKLWLKVFSFSRKGAD